MIKILLVDDDKNLRETIQEFLTFENYEVLTATNGQEALDILNKWIPDIIICDIMMPIMDGNQLHEVIKDDELLSSIPFVFLSAKKETNIELKYKLQGADDFLSKPFKIADLSQIIKVKSERFKKLRNNFPQLFTGENKYLLHELNTPLNGVIVAATILKENEEILQKDDKQQLHNSIEISGLRLQRTLENLLRYERDISNNLDLDITESSEISEVFKVVMDKIISLNIEDRDRLKHNVKKSYIALDQKSLSFVLYELIDNALKFSENKIVKISGSKYKNNHYEIIITDTGVGFSQLELKNIKAGIQFNREKQEQQGLGLGLYLSKKIVKNSNGVLSIVSKENSGTQISIFLPLYKEAKKKLTNLI